MIFVCVKSTLTDKRKKNEDFEPVKDLLIFFNTACMAGMYINCINMYYNV